MACTYIEEKRNGRWKIMLELEGRNRETNDADTKEEAIEKAQRAATKRGIPFMAPAEEIQSDDEELPPPPSETEEPPAKDFMDPGRPKGSPDVGTRVREILLDDTELESTVTGYLSSQFITETDDGKRRIIHLKSKWETL